MSRFVWTPERLQFLRDNYVKLGCAEIGRRWNISRAAVSGQAYRLGLSIPKAIRSAHCSEAQKASWDSGKRSAPTHREPRATGKPRPQPPGRRQFRDAQAIVMCFVDRNRPSDTRHVVEKVARKAGAKLYRQCAWRPCPCMAEPGKMFCDEHESYAMELRA